MFSLLLKIKFLCTKKPFLPQESYFPVGTEFLIKEFGVPIVRISDGSRCKYQNWYGGRPRPYSAECLRVDNNWPAESFEEWIELVKDSLDEER